MLWYARAAEQGHVPAQLEAGRKYAAGEDVERNEEVASSWIRRAAARGDPRAQFDLGVMYRDGRGVTQDYAAVLSWFRRLGEARGRRRRRNARGPGYRPAERGSASGRRHPSRQSGARSSRSATGHRHRDVGVVRRSDALHPHEGALQRRRTARVRDERRCRAAPPASRRATRVRGGAWPRRCSSLRPLLPFGGRQRTRSRPVSRLSAD